MRTTILLLTVLHVLFCISAGYAADAEATRLLQQFQTTEEDAKTDIFYAVTDASPFIPNLGSLKGLSSPERVNVVELTGKYLKQYLASDEFREKYNEYRENRKPAAPEPPKYSDQLIGEQRDSLKKSIAEMRQNGSQLAKEQRVILDEVIKTLEQQLADLEDPQKTGLPPDMDASIRNAYENQVSEYNRTLAEWEKTYPENDPRPMIRSWLTAFLEESSAVDFAAETTPAGNGVVKFVNQEYEQKSKRWKMCYRAGKETVDAARAFALAWLEELNK